LWAALQASAGEGPAPAGEGPVREKKRRRGKA